MSGCAKSGDIIKIYINTECNVFIVLTQRNILSSLAKLALNGNMFGKGDGFSDSAEAPSRRDFRVMMYSVYCQRKSFQQRFQSLSKCFGDHSLRDLQFNFISAERRLKIVTAVANLRLWLPGKKKKKKNVAKVKCLIKEDRQITEN